MWISSRISLGRARARAMAPQRGLDGAVPPPDDHQVLPEEPMRLLEEVGDVGEVFSGNPEEPRAVHVADGEDHPLRVDHLFYVGGLDQSASRPRRPDP